MCADFYYYLNRQGLQGRDGARGEKGEPGNTPTFRTGVNTPTVYTLIVDSGDGVTFETGNLKYPMRDDGGDYLRYDRDDATVVLGNPNYADLQGNVGEVKLASAEDHEGGTAENTDAVSYELFESNNEGLDSRMDGIDGEIERVDGRVTREIQDRDDADTALSDRIYLLDTNKANKTDVYTKTQTDNLLAGKANTQHTHTLSQITNAGTFAAKNTLDYNSSELTNKPVLGNLASKNTVDYQTEVTNKPTIPTVGDGTITITQGGVTKGTFTTNQSGNSTIELDAGGGGGTTYTEGPGITIDQDNEISVNVDNNTIIVEGNSLKANIPDVSNFVTDTQLANTLEAYPTNQTLSNLVDYVTETSEVRQYIPASRPLIFEDAGSFDTYNVTQNAPLGESKYAVSVEFSKTVSLGNSYTFTIDFLSSDRTVDGFLLGEGIENSYIRFIVPTYEAADFRTGYIIKNLIVNCQDIDGNYFSWTPSSGTGIVSNNFGTELHFKLNEYPYTHYRTYITSIGFTLDLTEATGMLGSDFVLRFDTMVAGNTNYGYLYSTETITTTKAIIADTAVDGTTIDVNSNGQLTYIGPTGDTLPTQTGNSGKFLTTDGSTTSWATVSQPDMTQYYTKTQTDSLLDGKISNNVVQYPLEYLPDTTGGLDLHNISYSTLTDTRVNGNFIYQYPYLLLRIFNASDNTYKNLYDNKDLINQNTISFCEINLINGLNFSGTHLYSNNSLYVYVLGKYNNSTFIPLGYLTSTDTGCKLYIYKESDIGHYDLGAIPIYSYTNVSISLYKPGSSNTGYISYQWSTGGDIKTCTFTQEESSTLNECTHVRMMAVATVNETGASTINLNTARFVNPDPTTFIVTDGTYADRSDTFQNSDNLFDAHPASLSLKYDSNTLGVNANNELYAQTYTLPTASTSTLGGVKVDGSTITIDGNGVISSAGGSDITIDEANLSTENFVEEGSPTITRSNGDVIITSSSWDDYARSANNIDINNNVFEVKTAIKPTVSVSSDNILAQRESTNVYGWSIYQTDTGLGFWMNKDGNNVLNQVFSYSFTTNVKYYIKLTGNGSEIGMYVKSENDSDYTKIGYIGTNVNLSFTNGPTPIRTCYSSGLQYINDTSVSKNGTMIYQGVIPFNDTLTKASTSQFGLVKIDGTTITVDSNGVISAASSTPSNMVTTDTNQTITGQKTFTNGIVLNGYKSMVLTQGSTNVFMQLYDSDNSYVGWRNGSQYAKMQYYNGNLIIQNSNTSDPKVYRLTTDNVYPAITSASNFLLEKDMLDGTTLAYDSTSGKISAAGSAPIKKTITQASANISESSGTITVTDTDVTTSTMVTLYPGDTTTEDWLANNLASNIITEGTGSFTFTINGTLPSTFSMYYIIQEVS